MQKRIKVLQIQPEYNVKSSGISDLAEQIVKALPPDQYEVMSLYISGKPQAEESADSDEHVEYLDISGKDLKGLRLKPLFRLYQLCKKEQFDVIICHRFKTVSLVLQLNKILKTPLCIGVSHMMDEYHRKYRQWQIKLFIDRHWRFVGVSEAVRDGLQQYGIGLNSDNTLAITNAIDVKNVESIQLDKQEARKALGLSENVVIIGALGRLVSVKGHRYLISAFAKIHAKYPNVHLGIIGEGKERKNLEILIQDLGLQNHIHLLGFHAHALKYIPAFDIWAMPSLSEGLGLALLEGMSAKLPIIASNVPAMAPLIAGAGGIATPPGDIDALAGALDTYLQLPLEQLRLAGQKAFDYLQQHHDIEHYRASYRLLIESNLKNLPR